MTAPSINTLENASDASFWPTTATAWGMTEMTGANGAPLQVATANGCTAAAFIDSSTGDVIVAFEGTTTKQQSQADALIMNGTPGDQIAALQDAVSFTRIVIQTAAAAGIPASMISISGHSLGGTLAEYAAAQTGLAGASFAGAGLPGYAAPAQPAANFTSYIERGDAYANWASDGSEAVLVKPGTTQDHYGQVVMLGAQSQNALSNQIIADYQALIPAVFTGHLSQAVAKITTDFDNNLMTIHGMNVYAADIAKLASPSVASAIAGVSAESSFATPDFRHPITTPAQASQALQSATSGLDHLVSAMGTHQALPSRL